MLSLPLLLADKADIEVDGVGKLADKLASSSFDYAAMGEFIGLVAVVMVFLTPIIIVFAILANRTKRQRMINETVLKLAESGHPIPPEILTEPIVIRQKTDLRSAVRMMTIGISLMGFFTFIGVKEGVGVGFIPLMIGVGYFVSWKLEQGNKQP